MSISLNDHPGIPGGILKLCFVNKVREEQMYIINPISTWGDQSVINSGQDK